MPTLHDQFTRKITNLPHAGKVQPGEWFLNLECGHTLRIGINPNNAAGWFCPMCFHQQLVTEREALQLRQLLNSR